MTPRTGVMRPFRLFRGSGVGAVLSRGAVAAFAINLAGAGGTFALHVLLSRTMGGTEYGIYVYAVTWITVLALIAKMGWDTTLVRYIPAYDAGMEYSLLRGVLRRGISFTFAGGVFLAGLSAVVTWLIGEQLKPGLRTTFLFAFLLLPVMAQTQVVQSALRGFRRVPISEVPDRILRPILLAGVVLVAARGLGWRMAAETVILIHLAAMIIALATAMFWLGRSIPKPVRASGPTYRDREWLSVSFPFVVLSATHLILNQVDVIMVGSILGTTEAGIYAVASRVAVLVLFALTAINVIAGPMISQLHAQKNILALQHVVTLVARGSLVFSLGVGIALTLFGKDVLSLFGTEFVEGYVALVILTSGQIANAAAGCVALLLTMTGHERGAALIMVLSIIVNIGLNAALIPIFGLAGAACATAFTTAMWNVMMLVHVRRRLGIQASVVSLSW